MRKFKSVFRKDGVADLFRLSLFWLVPDSIIDTKFDENGKAYVSCIC